MKQNKLSVGKTNIVGVTGGTGAGKSQVLMYLEQSFNCRVIYSDNVANDIKKKGYPAYDEIVNLLGKEILGSDGEIDKKKMASAIFNNKDILENVNNILHPKVNAFIINIMDEERRKGQLDFVFVEAALLLENGYKDLVDEMWYVYADEDIRRRRLKETRGYSDEKVTNIFGSQLDEKTFRENADFVIDNSGALEEMKAQIDNKLGEWVK